MDKEDPIIALRRVARESYDVSLRLAMQHMSDAEKSDSELSSLEDIIPSQAAAHRRASHIRMAEVYAQIAQACQKVPGQQF
jgi:hypothetical protein